MHKTKLFAMIMIVKVQHFIYNSVIIYNWPTNSSFSFQILLKTSTFSFWSSLSFLPHSLYIFLSYIYVPIQLSLSVSLWLSNALNKNSIIFSLPRSFILCCSAQHLTTELKRTSLVLITISKNGTLILNSENTQKTVLMLVLYNCPKQSEKWIKNYQFNLCALNTLFIISSGLLQTLGPRCIFPSKYILFNVQPKKYSCFFNT